MPRRGTTARPGRSVLAQRAWQVGRGGAGDARPALPTRRSLPPRPARPPASWCRLTRLRIDAHDGGACEGERGVVHALQRAGPAHRAPRGEGAEHRVFRRRRLGPDVLAAKSPRGSARRQEGAKLRAAALQRRADREGPAAASLGRAWPAPRPAWAPLPWWDVHQGQGMRGEAATRPPGPPHGCHCRWRARTSCAASPRQAEAHGHGPPRGQLQGTGASDVVQGEGGGEHAAQHGDVEHIACVGVGWGGGGGCRPSPRGLQAPGAGSAVGRSPARQQGSRAPARFDWAGSQPELRHSSAAGLAGRPECLPRASKQRAGESNTAVVPPAGAPPAPHP